MTPSPPQQTQPQPDPNSQSQQEQTVLALIKQYEEPLKNLTEKNCRLAVDREKVFQYAIVKRNDFYYRGNQHLVPTFTGSGEAIDFKPVNNQLLLASGKAKNNNTTIYDYVINHFRGDMRKFVGVLGSKSPNVKGRPTWQGDDAANRRVGIADDCANYLRMQWDSDAANRYLALSLGKNGTTFLHTPFISDAERYGTHSEPVWGMQAQKMEPDQYVCKFCGTPTPGDPQAPPSRCSNPACRQPLGPEDFQEGATEQIPAITGYKDYPNGTVELFVHSAYDVTTPFYVKDLEHCPWLWKELDDDSAVLVSRYPGRGLEEDLERDRAVTEKGSGSAQALGELAREQASSPMGYNYAKRPNRWTKSEFWLRPSMYLYLLRTGTDTQTGQAIVDDLKKRFTRGLKLTFVNKHLVDVEHERLDEVWVAVKPETSEYLYADPIFNDYIQGADIMNDAWNINIQLLETSIPALLFDPNILDPKKVRRGFQPNEFIPMIQGTGAQADKSFFRVPTSDPKPEIVQFQKVVIDTLREIVGLLPAIWGGDDNTQTAEQSRRRLNQALMVLATTWNEIRKGWAKAYRNGVRQLARYSLGRLVSSQGDPESVTVREMGDMKELLQGGWEFECDQAIPMNWAQLRDFVTSIMTEAPQMAHAIGLDDPNNFSKINEGIGIPGWKFPGQEERTRVHDLISRLMQDEPLQDPMTGDPMPSIQIDFRVTFNPNIVMQVIHEWANSEAGRTAEGTPGFQNVIAAGLAALQQMAPPPMPGGPGGPPPGPPPPGGPPAPHGPRPHHGRHGLPQGPNPNPGAPVPGPLPTTQPPEAPEQPLQPVVPPQGGINQQVAGLVQ